MRLEHPWPTKGTLNVNFAPSDDPEALSLYWFRLHPDGLRDRAGTLRSDPTGALLLPTLPAGRGQLHFILKADSGVVVERCEVEIRQGETVTRRL